ncbi:MAG: hypothetical protein V7K47_06730 [Nostoc sp.]
MNEDLKALGLFGSEELSWSQVKSLLEMRVFLGLKPGIHSREQFTETSKEKLQNLFNNHGFNVEAQLQRLQKEYKNKHRVAVQLVLEAD